MDVSIFQAFLIGVACWLGSVENSQPLGVAFSDAMSKPIVGGTIVGIILGMLLSIMMIADLRPFKSIKSQKLAFLRNFNPVAKIALVYITVIRGTPTVVQLFILANVIFIGSLKNTPIFVTASLAFGLNSAAYVAEIIRAGIQGLDKGQLEAARALGMSYKLSMRVVVIPQAVKKIMPALVSEFIVLLKETSVVSMIGGVDLTFAAKSIISVTYRAAEPWIVVALIYLALITIFTYFMRKIEKRLRESD